MLASALVLLALSWAGQAQAPMPIRGVGVIDGKIGLAFWPSEGPDSDVPIVPEGYSVHLVPAEEPDSEIVRPCGEWFLLPPEQGRYMFWLEGHGKISAHSYLLSWAEKAAGSNGEGKAVVAPLVPSSTVVVERYPGCPSTASARVLQLDASFARRAPLGPSGSPEIVVPAGPVLAAVFDNDSKTYLALTKPFEAKAGTVASVVPSPPETPGTDVLVRLNRPEPATGADLEDVSLALRLPDGREIPPLAVANGPSRIYCAWYGIGDRRGTIVVRSKSLWLPDQTLVLRPGSVEYLEQQLLKLPAVHAELLLPEELQGQESTLTFTSLLNGEKVRATKVASGTQSVEIPKLPALPLSATLSIGNWDFEQQADLSSGRDETIVFAPSPIHVSGRVLRGEEGIAAEVAFSSARDQTRWLTTDSDSHGDYELVLMRPGVYSTRVRPLDSGEARFDNVNRLIERDTAVDFRFSRAVLTVKARDRATLDPVPGAEIQFNNSGEDRTSSGREFIADENGEAVLPLLKPGHVVVAAKAEGFKVASTERDLSVDSPPDTVVLDLDRIGDTGSVKVVLPSGAPASGARVALLVSGELPPVWGGTSNHEGTLDVPLKGVGTILVAQASGYGFVSTSWPPASETPQTVVRLPSAAPPLILALHTSDDRPASFARLAVWAGGLKLRGALLQWLLAAPPAADVSGVVRLIGLPEQPIGVLAWQPGSAADASAASGAVDHLRTVVLFPWSETVPVTVLQ